MESGQVLIKHFSCLDGVLGGGALFWVRVSEFEARLITLMVCKYKWMEFSVYVTPISADSQYKGGQRIVVAFSIAKATKAFSCQEGYQLLSLMVVALLPVRRSLAKNSLKLTSALGRLFRIRLGYLPRSISGFEKASRRPKALDLDVSTASVNQKWKKDIKLLSGVLAKARRNVKVSACS